MMTIEEAKYACESRAVIVYNGATYKVNGILTWF